MLGDAGGCLRALDRAERALVDVPREGAAARPRFNAVDRTWLDGERGASLARLGRTGESRGILQRVITRMGPGSERDRLWLGAALATTYAQDGEREEACRVASAVLARASQMQLDPVLHLVDDLYQQLRAQGPLPAVSELDEQLHVSAAG
jgi:hypothetical protein